MAQFDPELGSGCMSSEAALNPRRDGVEALALAGTARQTLTVLLVAADPGLVDSVRLRLGDSSQALFQLELSCLGQGKRIKNMTAMG